MRSKSKPGHVLVIPDIHYRKKPGGEDRRTLDAVKKFASDNRFSHVVFLGDVVDHNSISSHNVGDLKAVSGETVWGDYEHINRELDEWERVTPGAEKVFIEGNHEYRANRLVNAQPQMEGIEPVTALKLEKRGWLWVPFWTQGTTFDLGRASFGHGRYTTLHHAYKHAIAHGRNFYYGHLHDTQSHTIEREGDNLKYEAASLGCLCTLRQFYLKGRPTRWQQAVTTFRFRPNGYFNRYTTYIFNHSFVAPDGRFYKG